jgi:splicing factor 3B subunit 3
MKLYSLTLQKPGAASTAVVGNFSTAKAQEFAVASGHVLDLLRPGEDGKLHVVSSTEMFGIIRTIQAFKLHATGTDFLLVGSDSGRAVVLEYDSETVRFRPVFSEPFGKTGCRRITPGQYIAADPAGRAFMMSAVEKQKFVYTMNRVDGKPSISSPLEAHKGHTVTFATAGLDNGVENPLFAALEVDYADSDSDPKYAAPPSRSSSAS